MQLRQLQLTSFRNFSQESLRPGPAFNIIWGDNAQGKTSLLEAIFLLVYLRSFRSNRLEELIRKGDQQTLVKADIERLGVAHRLALGLTASERHCRVDGKGLTSSLDFIGRLAAVFFSPEEVNLVRSYPAGRRTLIDRAVFLADRGYLEIAREYQRALRQRNRLLKDERPQRELEPWTQKLIGAGARLRRARIDYLSRLKPLLQEAYKEICSGKEQIDVRYPHDEKDLEDGLGKEFARSAERERRYRQTLAGPHRDDAQFLIDGEHLKNFGSQGQQRSFILALKCAQALDLEQSGGEPPLLLLDDLTSELDPGRRQALFDFLQRRRGQTFLTTTDIAGFSAPVRKTARFFKLTAGRVVTEETRE